MSTIYKSKDFGCIFRTVTFSKIVRHVGSIFTIIVTDYSLDSFNSIEVGNLWSLFDVAKYSEPSV